jgi:tetratricopeptide (TPR) repeat protein
MNKMLLITLMASTVIILSGCLSPAEKHVRQGDLFMEQGNWDNAIAEYISAKELDPSVVVNIRLSHAYANRGTAYYMSGNYNEAIYDFQNAFQQDNAAEVGEILSSSYKARAMQYLQNGDYDRAMADADAILVYYNGSDALAFYIRGTALIGKGQWDQAITDLSKAVGIDAAIDSDLKLPQAYLERAKLLLAQGLQTEATQYIERAIVLANEAVGRDSSSAVAYRRLANAYILLQKYDSSLDYLSKAMELDPNDSVAYTLMAEIQFKTGDSDAALSNLDKAISLDPNNAAAYYQRAVIYVEQGKMDLAIAGLSKAIELEPQFYLYHNRALVYLTKALQEPDTKNSPLLELAIDDWTKTLELKPDLFQPRFWRGYAYFKMEKWDLAEADLKKAIELSNDPETTGIAENLLQQIARKQAL